MQRTLIILSIILLQAFAQDFSSSVYQAQTRDLKLQQLLTSINADSTSGTFPSTIAALGLFTESMTPTVDWQADTFPSGRSKLIHSVGIIAPIQFIAEANSIYTGLFQGSDSGFIRLSTATQPDYTKTTAAGANSTFIPGLGLKFLVDGQPSVNLVAMYSVNGAPSWNFFREDFSTHIPGASGVLLKGLAYQFSTATPYVQTVGLLNFSSYDQQGNTIASPVSPWRLIFRAPEALKNQYTDEFQDTFINQLTQIPANTTLYNVYAIADPSEACEVLIGSIVITSQLVTSLFGDQNLFLQHQNMANDLNAQPQWTNYTPVYSAFGSGDAKIPEGACPYARYL